MQVGADIFSDLCCHFMVMDSYAGMKHAMHIDLWCITEESCRLLHHKLKDSMTC